MTDQRIVDLAIENLQKQTGIKGNWKPSDIKELDGQITLAFEANEVTYNVEIKNELRFTDFEKLERFKKKYSPFILIVWRVIPQMKEKLRRHNIDYLEANGNVYLKNQGSLIWIDINPPLPAEQKKEGRAFTKTGLKVIFEIMLDESLLNKPYRYIAEQTGTGIGNVSNIMADLKSSGFLLALTKDEYKLVKKKELIDRWAETYNRRLKPSLFIGTFRFLKEDGFLNWQKLQLQLGKSWWGGEAAGNILTNYLLPEELTLYTTETRSELIRAYQLIPEERGKIKVYEKFWNESNTNKTVVPPLLAYSELIVQNDRRSSETAQKIYDEFLQDKI